jgi:hypothetical protein
MPLRQRQEVQEVLRCLTRGPQADVRHTDLCHIRAHPSCPGELNLRKAVRREGKNRGGLQHRTSENDGFKFGGHRRR